MRIAGLVVFVVVACLFGFWALFVRAPTPDDVCRHILAVTIAEAGDQAMALDTQTALLDRMTQQCVAHKRDKIELRGRIQYAKYARCVVRSTTLQAIEGC